MGHHQPYSQVTIDKGSRAMARDTPLLGVGVSHIRCFLLVCFYPNRNLGFQNVNVSGLTRIRKTHGFTVFSKDAPRQVVFKATPKRVPSKITHFFVRHPIGIDPHFLLRPDAEVQI